MISPHLFEESITNCNERIIKRAYEKLMGKQNLAEVCQQLKQFLRSHLANQQDGTQEIISLSLLILAICSYRLNDFCLSHLISHFANSLNQEIWRKYEFEWITIQSLQKLNRLQECIMKIEKFMNSINNQPQWSQLYYILQLKKIYIYDFMIYKSKQVQSLSVQEKFELATQLNQLFEKQAEEKYFQQEGYPAYLISVQWIARFSLFTKYYELKKEDPSKLKEYVAKKNNQLEDETFVEIFKNSCDQQTYLELEKISNFQQNEESYLCPIYNDDLIDLHTKFDNDPLRAKQYTNFALNKQMRENVNYLIVSSQIWKFLYGKFGGMEIKRIVICRSQHQVELNLLCIKTILFPQNKQLQLQFNGNERIEDLMAKIKRITKNQVRHVWKPTQKINFDELLETQLLLGTKLGREQILEQSEIGPDDLLLIELDQPTYKLQEKKLQPTYQGQNCCASCGSQESPLYLCECKSVKYCNEQCQYNDLKNHQTLCKKILEKDTIIFQLAKKHKVKQPAKITKASAKGICGLGNLGNTCFMNSSIQCLSNVFELTEYLIYNTFLEDLNEKNVLGTGGKLACSYAELLKELYESTSNSVQPWNVKKIIGQYAPQFNGTSQQDSQELLSYLLDGLHEDLNRIKVKPYVADVDYKGQSDEQFSTIYWENHKKRNDSIIVDLFTGQFKSRVECPECQHVSITFDPFVSISLPIPVKEFVQFSAYLIFRDSNNIPLKISQSVQANTTAKDIIDIVSQAKNINPEYLRFYKLHDSQITDFNGIPTNYTIKQIKDTQSMIFLFEEFNDQLDEPISKYDSTIQSQCIQVIINAKKYDESKNTEYQKITFSRICFINSNITNQQLHIKIYQIFRPYLLTINENRQLSSSLTKEFENFLLNEKKKIFQNISDEYKELLKMKDIIYQLTDEKLNPIKFNESQIETDGNTLQLIVQFKIRPDFLKLNRCIDADFQMSSMSSTISQPLNIMDCLNAFCQEEILETGNEWFCRKCKKDQKAKKQMQIYKAPKILILHLKRFKQFRITQFYGSYSTGASKIVQFIDCPLENLNLQEFILDKTTSRNYIYDLFAVSNHYGGIGGGHYTAYAKNTMFNTWYDFNDSIVKEFKGNPITDAAYVLFYRKRKQ